MEVTPDKSGRVGVTAILFRDPVPWTPEYWERHPWISLEANHEAIPDQTPVSKKPRVLLDVPLDATLGDVLVAACETWDIRRGSEHLHPEQPLHAEAYWIDFARGEDESGFDYGGRWTHTLPIATADGEIEQLPWPEVTYRQLVVSSQLGVLEADITRPYVRLVFPQGETGLVIEGSKAAAEAIRAAYAALPVARHALDEGIRLISATARPTRDVIDDAMRLAFVLEFFRRAGRRIRARRRHHRHSE